MKGFTLIELMIVVAVIAILAAIAYPNFREQARKARRSDAMAEVGRVQLVLERWRADHPTYAGSGTGYPVLATSSYYDFALGGQSATGYSITATPKGSQVGDTCGVLTLAVSNASPNPKPAWATASCNP